MNPTVGVALQGGKYLLEQALGEGGLTFRATQTSQNRKPVLLKALSSEAVGNRDRLTQWLEKVRALAQCRHPALATVLEWFEEDGKPFVVMDWVMGQSLADRVRLQGPLTEIEALQSVRQVGSALSLLHRQGLVHGDVKPENLIQPIGSHLTVLVDFGCPAPEASAYAAIEAQPTPATDIYALAASLYFLLTGTPPIPALQQSSTPLPSPRQVQPQISPTVEAAILAGMELNSAGRPATIAAWFSLLDASAPVPSTNGAAKAGAIELPLLVTAPSASSSQATAQATPQAISSGSSPANAVPANGKTALAGPRPGPTAPGKPPTSARSWLPRSFAVGAVVAGTIGLGVGLALRISGGTGPGSSFFHTEQAFPKKNTLENKTSVDEQFSPPPQSSIRTSVPKATPPKDTSSRPFDSALPGARSLPDVEPTLPPERKATRRRSAEPIVPQPADSPTVEPVTPEVKATPTSVQPASPSEQAAPTSVQPAPIPPPPPVSAPPASETAPPPPAPTAPIAPAPSLRSPKTGV